jgi:hypothetical protein
MKRPEHRTAQPDSAQDTVSAPLVSNDADSQISAGNDQDSDSEDTWLVSPESVPAEPITNPAADSGSRTQPADAPEVGAEPEGEPGPAIAASIVAPGTAPVDAAPGASAPAPAPSGAGTTGSMIVGGVLSAALGAAAALAILPNGWRTPDTSALDQRISALETQQRVDPTAADMTSALAPLESRLSALEGAAFGDRLDALEGAATPDLTSLTARLDALEANSLDQQARSDALTAAVTGAVAPLSARMDQIEADIATQAQAAVGAALAQARSEIDAQAAALSSRESSVAAAQERIAARAALADLTAAAESGAAQAGALATLAAVTDVPAPLAPFGDGLVTLAELQGSFARAARAALAADAPSPEAGVTDRLLTFLRSQTGARSLAPRDGTDTDAVLSRAEASLRQGDLAATLAELGLLTGGPAEAMANWQAAARTRVAALDALDALQTQLTRN